jgi:hypothetical protein
MEKQKTIPQSEKDGQETEQKIAKAKTALQEFRQNLYKYFSHRADAIIELIDALASNTNARSVVELSLSSLFRREYSSVYDAIAHFFVPSDLENATQEHRVHEQGLLRLIAPFLTAPEQRKYWLFGTDVTYLPRQFAQTLAERTFVHCPNAIAGNKPITIGHDYSILSYLPEKTSTGTPPWVVPLIVRRVQSTEKASQVGAEQIAVIVTDKTLPFQDALCLLVEDSAYSGRKHLATVAILPNTVSTIRFPGNRVVYRKYECPEGEENTVGHPTWYGDRFDLKDPDTWPEPDETAVITFITKKGKTYTAQLEGWHNMVRTGKKDIPMHQYPFTLVRARVLDTDGNPVFKRDMWLITIGERRQELSLVDIWEAYGQRYDVEHFYRYGKQRLLMAAYQTPDVEREENWWQIVQLAYVQLWLARSLAEALPNPWERYLPLPEPGCASPATVQRDFERIIRQIGTPAQPPKPRGNSPGRAKGDKPPPRPRQPVIKKG